MKPNSKIIQIIQVVGSSDVDIIVLTEDGSMWRYWPNQNKTWTLLYESPKIDRPLGRPAALKTSSQI